MNNIAQRKLFTQDKRRHFPAVPRGFCNVNFLERPPGLGKNCPQGSWRGQQKAGSLPSPPSPRNLPADTSSSTASFREAGKETEALKEEARTPDSAWAGAALGRECGSQPGFRSQLYLHRLCDPGRCTSSLRISTLLCLKTILVGPGD